MNRTLLKSSLYLALVLMAPVAAAIPVPGLDVADLVARADIVAAGRVGAVVDHGEAFVDTPSGRRVPARSMTGELLVDHVLKGPPDFSRVQVSFVVPGAPIGYGDVAAGSYRVFFLKSKEDHYEFVSVHYPSVIAAPGAEMQHRSALDRVASAVAAVLRSPEMPQDRRREAVFVLSDTGGPVAVSALRAGLQDGDQTLRLSAAAALLLLGDVSALPAAEEALLHPDTNLPPEVLHNLRGGIWLGVKDGAAVPTLARLLSAGDTEVRRAAVEALRNTNSPSATTALAKALEDADTDVRYVAVIGLAEITGQSEWRPGPDEFAEDDARYLRYWRDWARRIGVLGVAASTATASQTGVTGPSSLLVAASRPPLEFTMALAYASIPSGLEIRESDDVRPPRAPVFDEKTLSLKGEQRVSLDGLVATFNSEHRDYQAVVMPGGVTVVRPINGTLPFLDEPSSLSQVVTVTGAMAAARRVFTAVDPGLDGPVLNSMGNKGEDIPVVLDGRGGRTVIETLNQIVTQAPGRSWVVTTREERDGGVRVIGFGFIDADGRRLTQPMRNAE